MDSRMYQDIFDTEFVDMFPKQTEIFWVDKTILGLDRFQITDINPNLSSHVGDNSCTTSDRYVKNP